MAKEQVIQKKIMNYLESEGAYVIKVIAASKSGVHDIIFCYEGLFGSVEVKTYETRNNVSALQEYNMDKIHQAGGHSIVAWELSQVEDLLRRMLA